MCQVILMIDRRVQGAGNLKAGHLHQLGQKPLDAQQGKVLQRGIPRWFIDSTGVL